MTPERWRTVKEIFQQWSNLPSEKRGAYLDKRCAADPELRSEIESLLATLDRDGELLDRPAIDYSGIERTGIPAAPAPEASGRLLVIGILVLAVLAIAAIGLSIR